MVMESLLSLATISHPSVKFLTSYQVLDLIYILYISEENASILSLQFSAISLSFETLVSRLISHASFENGYRTNKPQVYISNWFIVFPDYKFLRFFISLFL